MPGTDPIVESASAAAASVLAQLAAPTSQCCTVGNLAFNLAEGYQIGENAIVEAELGDAESALAAEAEISLDGWVTAEAAIQRAVGNRNFPTIVTNLVLAESNVTETAFNDAESVLATEVNNAMWALGQTEKFMQAEAAVFRNEGGCGAVTAGTVTPAIINSPALTGPQTIQLPAGKLISVVASAQSSGGQTVQITSPSGAVVFTASGKSSSGGTFTQIGQGTFTTTVAGAYVVTLTANAGILASAMATNFSRDSYLTTYTFATNDGGATAGDRDFNDLVVTIQMFRSAG